MNVAVNREGVKPRGNRPDYIEAAPYGCYKCMGKDRWCVIAVFSEEEWQALCYVLGGPPWAKEERFSSLSKRKEHEEELDQSLGEWTANHGAEEIVELLQRSGVPSDVVQNAENLARDPHLLAREFFVSLDHPLLGETLSDSSSIRFGDHPASDWKAAPLLGADNRFVYLDLLGLSEDEFSSYVRRGVIG